MQGTQRGIGKSPYPKKRLHLKKDKKRRGNKEKK